MRNWVGKLCTKDAGIAGCVIFFNLRKAQSPGYLFVEIPDERNVTYNLRTIRAYDQGSCRTVRFSNTYFQNTLYEWNLLSDEIEDSLTITEFKRKLLAIIRPLGKSCYDIHDIKGVTLLTKLCLKFSALKDTCFRHRLDCLTPMCNCGAEKENNEHYLLHCPNFDLMRADLFGQLTEIPALDIDGMNSKILCSLLLYGCSQLDNVTNRMILDASVSYINKTKRFQ